MGKIPVIVILGPTAVGKTALSVKLAKKWQGEVISGDSMQVYQGLDIGTAKITPEEMEEVPHHLIDVASPDTAFTAADFKHLTEQAIETIWQKGHLPIIAGGTGLYIQSVFYDYEFGQTGKNEAYRQKLAEYSNEELWQMLKEKDPKSASEIHANNKQRVIRALEVIHETKQPFSDFQVHKQLKATYAPCFIALDMERGQLYERINSRVQQMLANGLEQEAFRLYEQGIPQSQASKGIGYKEWIPYFEGNETKEEVIAAIQQNSRHFAKRQLTWFRNRMTVHWLDAADEALLQKADHLIRAFLEDNPDWRF
ncbi:tRNA (adenosine(37)-N6)-dimethylallyltransferase MiaA [Listeria costaricensis]|uniref:tRNA (adenosine(37)-N6)-dimethylallyltransferase MiaA n=1 Tax=Listeria costaricensis TaxID=2026604 RepID=UPI000C0872B1|nr:tRNA (adenosine(37)-N6)-dimethylallyltransferase MiaA [Listeria costaricensis]